MKLKVAEYNMEWMKNLFVNGTPVNVPPPAGKPESDWNEQERLTMKSQRLISVLSHLDADIIAVVEGPDTLANGTKTAKAQLELWMTTFGLTQRNYKVVQGHTSRGQQELCAIYDADKLILEHTPEGKNSFDEPFLADTLEQSIKEQYEHFRPPVELTVKDKASPGKLFKMIIAHAKSKGIFDHVDYARYEYLSNLNRRKLYAECMHMRERIDQWINEGDKVLVTGDINDGMGSDFYENRFGKSAIEILLGSVYEPELILKSALGKPKLGKYGWSPSSSSFTDTITKNWFTVLIDHILVSQDIKIESGTVLNPYSEPHKSNLSQELKDALKKGSDHFPVVTVIEV
ncbi:endonuclease/exonuclease/phosphatase family protein [Euzebyella saccharophila]|uniref:Endonuclease/exonuclease/phosphatase family protein n=1 Tax=Euzebyella saccharophila TaxID=679664 RepID=A0ABV8JLA2_9FLAO|nr:endonuclease/exonuclease/phosphatase family protein [Euzebyella saccharophila]